MSQSETIHDSPTPWVREHIERYVETDGEEGHVWNGYPTLLLTTRGRSSGELRRTALIYGEDNDRRIVIASKGGAPEHPSWYGNLEAEPEVGVQVAGDVYRARARTVTDGQARARLWAGMVDVYPPYEEYQERTEREIPVVVLERIDDQAPGH